MKLPWLTFGVVFLFLHSVFAQIELDPRAEKAVNEIMNAQAYFWNKGDIDRFMGGYWNSPSLVFVGKNGPTYGFQNTLNAYKQGYPDSTTMGQLHFDILNIQQWDENTLQLIGQYTLSRKEDQLTGFFTLLFRKIDTEWKIVSDHSSSS